ncbi:unnamed protein product, partial [Closterium sp. NIES-54]
SGAAGVTGAVGPDGARTGGPRAARAGGPAGVGAGDTGAGGAGPGGSYSSHTGLQSSTGLTPPLLCPPPDQSQPPLQPASPPPAPPPYAEQVGGLTEHREPVSGPTSPVRAVRTGRPRAASPTVPRLLAIIDTNPSFESSAASALVTELVDLAAICRLDYATALVVESGYACPPFVGEAITRPYSSQWQIAMDAQMVSWKSIGTYVDAIPLSGANIVDGMWIFRVKQPPGSPPAFKARYVARGFTQRQGVDFFQTFSPTPKMTTLWVLLHVAAQRDYELHSLDFITDFLQGSLHEEIWLHRPPGFTGSFPA